MCEAEQGEFKTHASCLSLGCYNRKPWTEWLKQHTFITHSSGDLKVQDQGDGRFSADLPLDS